MKICKLKSLVRVLKDGFTGYINVSEFVESKQRFHLLYSEKSGITAISKTDAQLDCRALIADILNQTDRKEILFIDDKGVTLN